MKKIICLILSLIILISVMSVGTVSVSAASQTVEFGKPYSYVYTDKNCQGTFTVPSTGVVTLTVSLPLSTYGSECSPTFKLYSGAAEIVSEGLYESGNYYLFLDPGTYSYNLYMDYYTLPTNPIKYEFIFTANYNNNVNAVTPGTTYTHYYSSNNCYSSFSLAKASTVTFTLTQPINLDGKAQSARLYIYDMNQGGKAIVDEYYSSSNVYNYTYTIRLPKGSYRFNYYCSAFYANDNYLVKNKYLLASTYKITAVPATAPKTPKLSHSVKTTKYSYYTTYDITASFADNQAYDGVELWTKENNGKWKLKDSAANTAYTRYTKVNLYVTSTNNYIVFYKVRTYSLYGTQKIYSSFSNVLYTKTSLKPKKPTVTVKAAKKAAKISWKKVSDADGYVVYRSTKKGSGYKKVTTIKKGSTVSYNNKKLTSKKTYYFKVRSYKKIDGVTIYSSYSTPKSVKVK